MSNVGAHQVGEFSPTNRMTIRTVRNPLDKATVVSVYPKEVRDEMFTIWPGKFVVPGGTVDNPGIAVIGSSSWFRDFDQEQPVLEVPVSAVQVADSLIKDYCIGLLGVSLDSAMPGMFFIPGEVTKAKVLTDYKNQLAESLAKQKNWFQILVRLADSLWARSNGNPLVVWDEMRLAARELGIDKPWIKDYQIAALKKCVACGGLRDPQYPICPSCKVVDPEHPLAKTLQFAK